MYPYKIETCAHKQQYAHTKAHGHTRTSSHCLYFYLFLVLILHIYLRDVLERVNLIVSLVSSVICTEMGGFFWAIKN